MRSDERQEDVLARLDGMLHRLDREKVRPHHPDIPAFLTEPLVVEAEPKAGNPSWAWGMVLLLLLAARIVSRFF